MKKVGIHGSTGRVGELLIKNLKNHESLEIDTLHAIDSFSFSIDEKYTITNDTETLLKNSDVVIDFSLPNGTESLLESAIKNLLYLSELKDYKYKEDAAFYLALAYIKNSQSFAAGKVLWNIKRSNGKYNRQADEILEKMWWFY